MWFCITAIGLLLLRIPGSSSSAPQAVVGQLHLSPWSVFPDMAVLDWYIRLKDKDRMVGCDLSYGAEAGGNTTSVENFLPLYRTIKIQPLVKNTSYWVHMLCRDGEGGMHVSDTVNFTTGIPALPAPQPAAVQYPVIQTDRLNRGMLSLRPSRGVSPHLLMGISCTILSMVVLTISSVMVVKKYKASGNSLEKQLEVEGIVIEADRTSGFQKDTTTLVVTGDELLENNFQQIVEDEEDQYINAMSF